VEDIEKAKDNYRLRVPSEVLTYELTGISPEDDNDRTTPDKRDNLYFTLDELRRFRLSLVHQASGVAVPDTPYHQQLDSATLGVCRSFCHPIFIELE